MLRKLLEFLASHPQVKKVNYAGLRSHAGHAIHYSQTATRRDPDH
ncbi:hypothetical protein Patl1_20903 [Pistacia atlantica]|uniref:Uncharacterized protein n=1 Tax=Pistacia atlantica TaxID=434234 RepID=A0ACC1BJQ7_9ROSI|nr:hypothetical protein Patl1_20903 [Pistacia atlantica]